MKKQDLFLVFLITLFPRLFISLQAYPAMYSSDEVSAISVAAMLAGYDWREVVSCAGYYGIGYLFIFAPLFHVVKNPIWIYRIILTVSSALVALSAPVCYLVLHKYFSLDRRIDKIVVSSICGVLNIFTCVHLTARNEEILYFLVWVIVYYLCGILNSVNQSKQRKQKERVLLLLLMYSLTVHTRAVCLIIGVVFADILYRVIYKKGILRKRSYLIILAAYIIISFGLKVYQSNIWIYGTKNTSVMSGVKNSLSKVQEYFNPYLFGNIFRIVFGQIYTAGAITGGLFIFALITILLFYTKKKYHINSDEKYIIVVGGMFLFCTIITIGGMSVTWLINVTKSMTEYGSEGFQSSYRAFTYLRYMGCYVSPVIMCAFVVAENNKKVLRRAVWIGTVAMCILTLFFMKMVLPYISTNRDVYFMALGDMKNGETVTCENWYMACILSLSVMIVGMLLVMSKKALIYFVGTLLLLIFERLYIFRQSTIISEQKYYMRANAGYELIQSMREEKELQKIYVYDSIGGRQQFFLYQYLNYTEKIVPGMPDNMEENILLFSNTNLKEILQDSFYWGKLDENEYVYCIAGEDVQLIEKCGIIMQKVE